MASQSSDYCPVFQHAIELIGRRWTASILRVLGDRSMRFGEIRSQIPGLSDRLLDSRLSELEAEGIVVRSQTRTEIHYSASEDGLKLGPIFDSIGAWAASSCTEGTGDSPGRRRC